MVAPAPVFIVNSLSETVAKRGSVLSAIAPDMRATLFEGQVFDQLDDIIAATKRGLSDWVFIEGGDGTAHGVLTAFLRAYEGKPLPRFTLIAGGMTNQVAQVIGVKHRDPDKIKALITCGGTGKHYPLLSVVTADDEPDYAGFLFSTGAVPMITNYTQSKLHSRGIGGSLAVLGGIWRGVSGRRSDVMHPTDIALSFDGDLISGSHLGTLATTLPSVFKGLDPFWDSASQADGRVRMVYADGTCRRLLGNILSLWRGHKTKDRSRDGLRSFAAARIDFTYDGPVVLDGERLSLLKSEFTLTTTRKVTFIC